MLHLKTGPSSPPQQSDFSTLFFILGFFFKVNLVTQMVAFLYVAYKQTEVSVSA